MRYATFSTPDDPTPRLGVVNGSRIADVLKLLAGPSSGPIPRSLLELIQSGPDEWSRIRELVTVRLTASAKAPASRAEATRRRKPDTRYDTPLSAVRLHAPIPRPAQNIVCLGLNYRSHAIESATARGREPKIPDAPVFFTKAPTTVSGPYDSIPWDRSATEQLDYEAELGVIVGVTGKNIPRWKSPNNIFGYTVINDFSARDLQAKHLQWFKGKSLDGSCPMGPVVVTSDEFGDPQSKRITLRVNGDTRQDATTGDMIFPVDVILEFLSSGMTIEAGEIISTGTPEGVGLGRTPPEYLKEGDLVETEIEGIGVLRNRIVVANNQVRSEPR